MTTIDYSAPRYTAYRDQIVSIDWDAGSDDDPTPADALDDDECAYLMSCWAEINCKLTEATS